MPKSSGLPGSKWSKGWLALGSEPASASGQAQGRGEEDQSGSGRVGFCLVTESAQVLPGSKVELTRGLDGNPLSAEPCNGERLGLRKGEEDRVRAGWLLLGE